MEKKPLKKDDWAVVLDFLSHGLHSMERSQPVAQVLGEQYFSLLEVIVRDDADMKVGEGVYIGDAKRDKVKYIRGRIEVTDLTVAAKGELEPAIKAVVGKDPQRFMDFFNKAGPLSTRLHHIELLPGIGKKHLWAIIEERKVKPFENFADLKKRVALLPDPEKMLIKRIMEELEDQDKYRIFVPKFEKQQKRF
jgi:putative nucleotide binding protein